MAEANRHNNVNAYLSKGKGGQQTNNNQVDQKNGA